MMSRVPLLYFSRGQLESLDWPDPVVATVLSTGDARSTATRRTLRRSELRSNFIGENSIGPIMAVARSVGNRTLGQYAEEVVLVFGCSCPLIVLRARWVASPWRGRGRVRVYAAQLEGAVLNPSP